MLLLDFLYWLDWPEESCYEYFEKEAAVALEHWRYTRGLDMPSDEEIEKIARQICEEHGWPYDNEKELP